MSDTHDRDRDRQSLRDLVKLSQQSGPLSSSMPASSARIMPPPSSGVADNSGLIDLERIGEALRSSSGDELEAAARGSQGALAAASAAPSSASAASETPAPRALASDLTPISPSVVPTETPEAVAPKAPAAPAASAAPVAPPSKTPLFLVVAVVLVGGGGFLATRKSAEPTPQAAPNAPATAAPPPPSPAAPEVKAEAPPPSTPSAPDAPKVAEPAKVVAKSEGAAVEPMPAADAGAGPAAAAVEAPKAGASKVPAAAAKTGPGTTMEKSIVDEMAAAVTGKLDTKAHEAESAATGPTGPAAGMAKPGTGQLSAAFAKVKGNAHNCLGGQELEVKTTVTFGSDGKVTKVAVANAPDPGVASCIEGAVGKATVPPFTEPSFSAPLTVR